jgi:hypothetical protein
MMLMQVMFAGLFLSPQFLSHTLLCFLCCCTTGPYPGSLGNPHTKEDERSRQLTKLADAVA